MLYSMQKGSFIKCTKTEIDSLTFSIAWLRVLVVKLYTPLRFSES